MSEQRKAWTVLTFNTVAFTICFMCWTTNGVLVTYLVDNGVYRWNPVQMGWLMAEGPRGCRQARPS